ncbi:diaminobutyrate--2-oxoglutarate transaminase [Gryllotalpicola sp.]|uniref:diaminobutyrate--2-oxoglutarate transaminase n=1 Tax=Gryllotalpicola sp. TaxID=1932787 RepID=UPI00260F0260|nr:diaminobutyrate--2-oxoglutarate transaminase [Gryllotalpicola sp.]
MDLSIFDEWESEVRGYVRSFPVVFDTAHGSFLVDQDGTEYIDFFSGASALNYGHNNPNFKPALIDYLEKGGIIHGLDMATTAKAEFIGAFTELVLKPRGLRYKLQFTGPTGANATEAAMKLARLATGRTNVVAFTHGYHGLSLGSLAATAAQHYRHAGSVPLTNVTFAPYDGYYGAGIDTLALLAKQLDDPSSGLDLPAAFIVECIQGEGGVNAASGEWLRGLADLARRYSIPLIVDDIQAGVGRSGDFFSFEDSGITPDLVVLSKSLSGYGLPMSLVLINPDLDVWSPGAHTGTFRGNNLAFVGATAALKTYWADGAFPAEIKRKGELVRSRLAAIAEQHPGELDVRGRGMFLGLASLGDPSFGAKVSQEAFHHGVIIETAGARDEVVKFLPALTIDDETLLRGLDIVEAAVAAALATV